MHKNTSTLNPAEDLLTFREFIHTPFHRHLPLNGKHIIVALLLVLAGFGLHYLLKDDMVGAGCFGMALAGLLFIITVVSSEDPEWIFKPRKTPVGGDEVIRDP